VAFLFLLILRDRRWLWLLVGASLLGLVIVALDDRLLTQMAAIFLRDETLDTKLVARLDIWLSALRGIEDHAFTGTGLGVFNEIVPVRYPYESVGLSYSVSQAHNVLLDTALTLGLPGLSGLLLLIAGMALGAKEQLGSRRGGRALAGGVLSATLVYLVFGLTDALSFSSPFGLVLWVLALALALATQREQSELEARDDLKPGSIYT
jgi:O-antigen ligase